MLAPAGIAPAVKARLAAAIVRAMAEPEVLGRVRSLSGEAFGGGPEQAAAFLRQQQAPWADVVRERKISVG